MELPNYRFPSARSVCQLIWEKARDFLQKAFTIIFVATVLIWFLQTFDMRLNVAASADKSLLAAIGSFIAPLFRPLGFGDWRVSTALITGFTAKESVVSTLTVLLGGDTAALTTLFTPFTSIVFLVFTLLYTPCVAAIAAVKRLNLAVPKAAAGVVVMQWYCMGGWPRYTVQVHCWGLCEPCPEVIRLWQSAIIVVILKHGAGDPVHLPERRLAGYRRQLRQLSPALQR